MSSLEKITVNTYDVEIDRIKMLIYIEIFPSKDRFG